MTIDVTTIVQAGLGLLMPARTFLGRLTSLSPLRAAAYGINEAAVAVKELL